MASVIKIENTTETQYCTAKGDVQNKQHKAIMKITKHNIMNNSILGHNIVDRILASWANWDVANWDVANWDVTYYNSMMCFL